jgi:hypothetical protein
MGWTGVEGGGSFDNWLCASMSFFFVKCVLRNENGEAKI